VLIPRRVYQALGPVDAALRHCYADQDYGLRADRLGFTTVLAPAAAGVCRRNPPAGTWRDGSLPRPARMRALLGPKGLPLRPHLRYTRRWGGPEWAVYALGGYVRALTSIALGRDVR
jgi:GT2 family glycosyltransferase